MVKLPGQVMQPRVCVGTSVVYLDGKPDAATVKVAEIGSDGALSKPVTISDSASAAVGMGTVRGPAIAAGKGGTRHVVWFAKGGGLFYARLNGATTVSKPMPMMGQTLSLDGGAAVAADGKGKVWIVWHAALEKGKGEAFRQVFIRDSTDDGLTFSEPWTPKGESFGACACCGLAAGVDATGELNVMYRVAVAGTERGGRLIRVKDQRAELLMKDEWSANMCVMTTAECQPGKKGLDAMWVNQFRLQSWRDGVAEKDAASKEPQNHPRMAVSASGATLTTWVSGSGWGKAGTIHWRTSSGESGSMESRLWSYAAPVALKDGRWAVIY